MRAASILLAAVLVVASCGGGGEPGGFLDDPGPIDERLTGALAEGVNPETVPLVQRNFLELCVHDDSDLVRDLQSVQRSGLLRVCGCSYDSLVAHMRATAAAEADAGASPEEIEEDAYERFQDLDDDMRTGTGSFDAEVTRLFAACIRQEAF